MTIANQQAQIDDRDFIRYSRQILLPECGEQGQQRLRAAHVAVIGVGGLGSHVAMQLAAAGIGQLTLFDGDHVEHSNLPRQLLFTAEDAGQNKAQIAAKKLMQREPKLLADAQSYLTRQTQTKLESADVVVDCSDNFDTRHLIARFCFNQNKVLISGAVAGFDGLLFVQKTGLGGCYHCLFPEGTKSAQNCASVGVMGCSVATIASMQAQLCLNQLLSLTCQAGQLQRFDFKRMRWHQAKVSADVKCQVCGNREQENQYANN